MTAIHVTAPPRPTTAPARADALRVDQRVDERVDPAYAPVPPAATVRAPRRVTFLMQNAHGGGGVARTVIALANRLADTHEVEIISMVTGRAAPQFEIDPRVTVSWILEGRAKGKAMVRPRNDRRAPAWKRALDRRPSRLSSEDDADAPLSRLTDVLLARRLATLRPGVLVSTRPTLHRAAARWSPPWVVRVAQDHLNYLVRSRNDAVMEALDAAATRLDAFVTLTGDDQTDYSARWGRGPRAGTRVVTIPNASPFELGRVADPAARTLVIGGRFERRKGFERVVAAFADVAQEFPDWQLHIYGQGKREQRIRATIAKHGVGDQVVMKGYTHDFEAALRSASVYVMGSTYEGLPMVLLEAQAVGLAVVAYDCPRGPADLVDDGVNGRLVPDGDHAAYVAALRQVMGDDGLRAAMGHAARENAASYAPARVADRWESLFAELTRQRRVFRPAARPVRPHAGAGRREGHLVGT